MIENIDFAPLHSCNSIVTLTSVLTHYENCDLKHWQVHAFQNNGICNLSLMGSIQISSEDIYIQLKDTMRINYSPVEIFEHHIDVNQPLINHCIKTSLSTYFGYQYYRKSIDSKFVEYFNGTCHSLDSAFDLVLHNGERTIPLLLIENFNNTVTIPLDESEVIKYLLGYRGD